MLRRLARRVLGIELMSILELEPLYTVQGRFAAHHYVDVLQVLQLVTQSLPNLTSSQRTTT
jgi:hypothetical protein